MAPIPGEYTEARTAVSEALQIYRDLGTRLGQANALDGLGDLARGMGEYAEARTRYTEALAIKERRVIAGGAASKL